MLSAVDFMSVVFLCLGAGGTAPAEGVLHRRAEREGHHVHHQSEQDRDHDRYTRVNRPRRPVMTRIYQASGSKANNVSHKIRNEVGICKAGFEEAAYD